MSERLRADVVVDHLASYPKAVIVYLEYLVFNKKLEVNSTQYFGNIFLDKNN